MRWRGAASPSALLVPAPWRGRVDAFMVACALRAGEREEDVYTLMKALSSKGGR